jgi:hypothetical protein
MVGVGGICFLHLELLEVFICVCCLSAKKGKL